eukprot:scaffold800_cov327-Pavlova_lutheri.AAC.1
MVTVCGITCIPCRVDKVRLLLRTWTMAHGKETSLKLGPVLLSASLPNVSRTLGSPPARRASLPRTPADALERPLPHANGPRLRLRRAPGPLGWPLAWLRRLEHMPFRPSRTPASAGRNASPLHVHAPSLHVASASNPAPTSRSSAEKEPPGCAPEAS